MHGTTENSVVQGRRRGRIGAVEPSRLPSDGTRKFEGPNASPERQVALTRERAGYCAVHAAVFGMEHAQSCDNYVPSRSPTEWL